MVHQHMPSRLTHDGKTQNPVSLRAMRTFRSHSVLTILKMRKSLKKKTNSKTQPECKVLLVYFFFLQLIKLLLIVFHCDVVIDEATSAQFSKNMQSHQQRLDALGFFGQ